jgi:hypothetical protein
MTAMKRPGVDSKAHVAELLFLAEHKNEQRVVIGRHDRPVAVLSDATEPPRRPRLPAFDSLLDPMIAMAADVPTTIEPRLGGYRPLRDRLTGLVLDASVASDLHASGYPAFRARGRCVAIWGRVLAT